MMTDYQNKIIVLTAILVSFVCVPAIWAQDGFSAFGGFSDDFLDTEQLQVHEHPSYHVEDVHDIDTYAPHESHHDDHHHDDHHHDDHHHGDHHRGDHHRGHRDSLAHHEKHHQKEFGHFHDEPICSRNEIRFPSANGRCHILEEHSTEAGRANDLVERVTGNSINTYGDGHDRIRHDLPSPRVVSNVVHAHGDVLGPEHNRFGTNHLFVFFGQFIDHDITRVASSRYEHHDIHVPKGDHHFHPGHPLPFERSKPSEESDHFNFRRFDNTATGWLDLSQVYGSSRKVQERLRSGHGGLMAVQNIGGHQFPIFSQSADVETDNESRHNFACGDPRCNEHLMLLSYHVMFVREHNRLARAIHHEHPDLPDEEIFQQARLHNIHGYQKIIYEEWLPALLGKKNMYEFMGEYRGYNAGAKPHIFDEFSAAAFRFGHAGVNDFMRFLNSHGEPVPHVTKHTDEYGRLRTSLMLFRPEQVLQTGGDIITWVLNGALVDQHMPLDELVTDPLRNELFMGVGRDGEPMDLVSLNIQRGRDHGLAPLDLIREFLHLEPYACGVLTRKHEISKCLLDFTRDEWVAEKLARVYYHFDDIDLFTAGLCEHRFGDGQLGQTWTALIAKQFKELRDGDRFFYLHQEDWVHIPASMSSLLRHNVGGTITGRYAFFAESGHHDDEHGFDY